MKQAIIAMALGALACAPAGLAAEAMKRGPAVTEPTTVPLPPRPATGQAVFERWCTSCHGPGPGHTGTQSLEAKYNGTLPAVLLERTDLPAEAVGVFVRQGILLMAPFRNTEITDAELAMLTAYVARNYKKP